jgi:hypothetical protein
MVAPHRSASMDALRRNGLTVWPGMTIYWIGDLTHQGEVSGHNPDDYPGVLAELHDDDTDPEVRALDFMIGTVFTTEQGWRLVNALINGADKHRVYYVIYRSTIWRRATGFKAEAYGGSNNHNDHVHVSGYVTDDENGSNWQSVLALGEEGDDVTVSYKIQSTDPTYHNRYYISNGIHRRGPIRQPKNILNPARAGTVEVLLTDAMRLSVSASFTWDAYLDVVAGPEFPTLVCNCSGDSTDHVHNVTTSTGPATPTG